jgi:hypothetical protein
MMFLFRLFELFKENKEKFETKIKEFLVNIQSAFIFEQCMQITLKILGDTNNNFR